MDDVKDKVKGFMKKVNNPFSSSSSSGKFKGQGRVLGSSSSSSSSSSGPSNPILSRYSQPPTSSSKPLSSSNSSVASANSKPSPQKTQSSDRIRPESRSDPNPDRKPANGFDPYDSLVTSGKRSRNGFSLELYECPICGQTYRSEQEVSVHVESCVNNSAGNGSENGDPSLPNKGTESFQSELECCVGAFLSGKPASGSVEIVLKLLKNIGKEPENAKFRKIRMSNPRIREAIGDVAGGIELLESVGFELGEEDGEMWAAMEVPSEDRICLIKHAIQLLEPQKIASSPFEASVQADEKVEPKKIDRQVR